MMGGMLVPVQPVDKAAHAIQTLFGVDPEFVTLCKTLYGPDVDPVEVWTDVFGKDEPSGSDMHVPGPLQTKRGRRRALEAAGIGATVIGGGLGVKDLAEQIPKVRGAAGRGKLVPAIRVTGVTGMLAGDAAATANQVSNASSRRKAVRGTKAARYDDVEKFSVGALADGFEAGMRKLPGLGGLAPKVRPAANKVGAVARDAKAGVTASREGQQAFPGTTSRAYRATNASANAVRNNAPRAKQTLFGSRKRTAVTAGVTAGAGYAGSQMRKRDDEENLDVVWAGEFEKFDEDKRLVFGWASVVEVNGVPVVDRQGDYIHPDDLENASYEYVIKSRVGGDMHTRDGSVPFKVSDLVESMVVTPEKLEKMGIPTAVAKSMPVGWWVGFKVHSDKHWGMVKKQARTGFSIHGRGKRIPMTMDQLIPGYH